MTEQNKMIANDSASVTQHDDRVKEMYCEECANHGDGYSTAVAFCVDCVEYKCVTCLKYHKRETQTHIIQDRKKMPQSFYFEKCSTHPQQLIKFYCSVCSKEACQICKDNEHVNCRDVNHLSTLASGIQKSKDFKDLQQNLDKLYADIKDTEKLLNVKSEVVDKQEEKATETCKEHKDKLFKAFKQLHQDLIEDFNMKMKETIERLKKERLELVEELSEKDRKFKNKITKAETDMKEQVASTNTNFKVLRSEHLYLVKNLKVLTSDLDQAKKLGQNCELFIKLQLAKQMCETLTTKY
ncbi:E3 ubiquitin-protein ligase TRIM33-like [Ruditapes philippinarum]|uniref:E3 ubiquitin-protein ligase TRIM33-like n=1 Tax=Ruditapes philippinarum TaxID=129788 RepID=UPI00295AEDC1|nr:E3 ubiquitin-protein ligase TRIM33-like [Ruditapes philippinarum]